LIQMNTGLMNLYQSKKPLSLDLQKDLYLKILLDKNNFSFLPSLGPISGTKTIE
jgi:hypothetical protein